MPSAYKAAGIFDQLLIEVLATANEEEDKNSKQQILG
jgi:hypothetical protein